MNNTHQAKGLTLSKIHSIIESTRVIKGPHNIDSGAANRETNVRLRYLGRSQFFDENGRIIPG